MKEIEDIEDIEEAAAVMALRVAVGKKPAKNAKAHKRINWIHQFHAYRPHAEMLINEGVFPECCDFRNMDVDKTSGRLQLLAFIFSKIDRKSWGSIGDFDAYYGSVKVNGHKIYLRATAQFLLMQVKEALAQTPKKGSVAEFRLYSFRRSDSQYWFQATGDRMQTRLMTFDSRDEAWDFYNNGGKEELANMWETHKSANTVHKTDVRNKENRIREGADWRMGQDVTPQQFLDTFGFRGVEFGLWVGKKNLERQESINHAYDAFMDLAGVINVSPRSLSLDGRLALAFGARGSGKASAHYETGMAVINLTKTRGAGSLAHEWFHAFDNYMGLHKTEVNAKFASEIVTKDDTRCELSHAFARLRVALHYAPMRQRAEKMDGMKSGDDYWSTTVEMAARTFENYVIAKLAEKGLHNDYLANVISFGEYDKNPDLYPYFLDEEMPNISRAFDEIFQVWNAAPFNHNAAAIKPLELVESNEAVEAVAIITKEAREQAIDGAIEYDKLLARAMVEKKEDRWAAVDAKKEELKALGFVFYESEDYVFDLPFYPNSEERERMENVYKEELEKIKESTRSPAGPQPDVLGHEDDAIALAEAALQKRQGKHWKRRKTRWKKPLKRWHWQRPLHCLPMVLCLWMRPNQARGRIPARLIRWKARVCLCWGMNPPCCWPIPQRNRCPRMTARPMTANPRNRLLWMQHQSVGRQEGHVKTHWLLFRMPI